MSLRSSETEVAWAREIERRVAAHERGEGRLYTAEEVMAEAARIAPDRQQPGCWLPRATGG